MQPLGALAHRGHPGQRERRVAALVPPRLEVVADRRAVHAVLLGRARRSSTSSRGANCSADALYPIRNVMGTSLPDSGPGMRETRMPPPRRRLYRSRRHERSPHGRRSALRPTPARAAPSAALRPPAPRRTDRQRCRRARRHPRGAGDPARHPRDRRRPGRPRRARHPALARARRAGVRCRRGRADPAAQAAGRGRRQPGRGDHARRPVRAPAAAAGRLPRPLGVRPAAVPGDLGPHDDPLVRRVLRDLPGGERAHGRRRRRGAGVALAVARAGDRGHGGPAHGHHAGAGAPLLARRPPVPGPGGRPRHRRRGVGARHPGAQVAGPRAAAHGPVRSPTPAACAAPSSRRCGCSRRCGRSSCWCRRRAIAVILALGAYGVADGTLTLGTLVAAATVVTYLHWPVESLGWLLAEASNAAGATERYFEVRDIPPAITDPPRPVALGRGARRAASSRASGSATPAPSARRCAGSTSTSGPARPWPWSARPDRARPRSPRSSPGSTTSPAGRVTVDGVDVRDVALAELRRVVATAFEDPMLFSASVRENVALGRPDAPDDEVVGGAAGGAGRRVRRARCRGGSRHPDRRAGPVAVRRAAAAARAGPRGARPPAGAGARRPAVGAGRAHRGRGRGGAAPGAGRGHGAGRGAPAVDRAARRPGGAAARRRIAAVGTHRELLATNPEYRALSGEHGCRRCGRDRRDDRDRRRRLARRRERGATDADPARHRAAPAGARPAAARRAASGRTGGRWRRRCCCSSRRARPSWRGRCWSPTRIDTGIPRRGGGRRGPARRGRSRATRARPRRRRAFRAGFLLLTGRIGQDVLLDLRRPGVRARAAPLARLPRALHLRPVHLPPHQRRRRAERPAGEGARRLRRRGAVARRHLGAAGVARPGAGRDRARRVRAAAAAHAVVPAALAGRPTGAPASRSPG